MTAPARIQLRQKVATVCRSLRHNSQAALGAPLPRPLARSRHAIAASTRTARIQLHQKVATVCQKIERLNARAKNELASRHFCMKFQVRKTPFGQKAAKLNHHRAKNARQTPSASSHRSASRNPVQEWPYSRFPESSPAAACSFHFSRPEQRQTQKRSIANNQLAPCSSLQVTTLNTSKTKAGQRNRPLPRFNRGLCSTAASRYVYPT